MNCLTQDVLQGYLAHNKQRSLGPYSRTNPRALWCSGRGGSFPYQLPTHNLQLGTHNLSCPVGETPDTEGGRERERDKERKRERYRERGRERGREREVL